jgi:hypothetical protein
MSGISPTSGTTSTLSSVGQSLLTSGTVPNAVAAATASTTGSNALSSYQTEFNTLKTQDTQELLYASFLSPEDSLANGNAVLQQAAVLLGSPGHPGTLATSESAAAATSTSTSSAAAADAVDTLPSVSSILAASDTQAQQTLTNYANAPVGSSIIDFQV